MADRTEESVTQTKRGTPRAKSFRQRLARLTYYQACQMLGAEGSKMLREASQLFEIDGADAFLGADHFRIRMRDTTVPGEVAVAALKHNSARNRELKLDCDQCEATCHHQAAALAYLLDAKCLLGLAAPPDTDVPLELLTHEELRQRALAERSERASKERMTVRSMDRQRPWTDYIVTSSTSGKTYRVSLRGQQPGQVYCSCPDFRTNRLGTCKHILHVQAKVERRFSPARLRSPYRRKNISLRLHYEHPLGVRFNPPYRCEAQVAELIGANAEESLTDAREALHRIEALQYAGHDVHIYPDAEDFLQRQLSQYELERQCRSIREQPDTHPLRRELLRTELLPYQLDGIAFAVGAGRAILADDMGLGKTIQGIGVAELLARLVDIQRVLVICPASLKSQWRGEIQRFCDRSVQLVLGTAREREGQYASETFFTVCNYEQVLRDVTAIERVGWDLIILDEGQRIKNWESKTSNVVRSLESPYRLVLTGTPLENRLGDLFTIVRFIDEQRLGPAYQFFHRHRVVDDDGRTLGYQRMSELREMLAPILLRRRRGDVARQLPERTDEIVRIEPTEEQLEIHGGQMQTALRIARKSFLTEMDLLRLRQALMTARMACNSTYLVNKLEPEYSSKLERLAELLEELVEDPTRKIVIFSEWRTMLDRIEQRLNGLSCEFVRLDGKVPQKQRAEIVARFQSDPECRVILMTNAGSTGLNLQSANTVINVDLPWNPAILEQRIGRAHRMGQQNPVHVYKLVSVGTLEERLLDALASKQELANAAIDMDSEVDDLAVTSGIEELRRRLEQILGPAPEAPLDRSLQDRVERETTALRRRREGVAEATGNLVGAALALASQLIDVPSSSAPSAAAVDQMTQRLKECVDTDSAGRPQLTISLPDEATLRSLATTLAKLLDRQAPEAG